MSLGEVLSSCRLRCGVALGVTLSSQAVPHFAETAQTALSLPRPRGENDSYVRDNRMVVEHATARACLRRASQALGDAVQELTDHLDFHRFFLTPSHRQSPAPPPEPGGRHRCPGPTPPLQGDL
ncbi:MULTISPECIES: hypothetical protein [Streptomyces]|nr:MULTISPECIES: hypothetical protein [Streptomyces]MBP5861431.1 hypothetical protein [Streptomyces sp. LBUM 1484]MBP5869636.1 hypothetical protein [Streptomyces sp. LBUM 1485]MBP5908049.1 hypothetical protein [Streptomyces sp. LBUM 1478]MBP5928972.1 hypothetical protein [Streptomyces sp. LBUM 1479]MBD9702034.1 hypothetical protein [Streptomyces caniscabiei]